MARESSERLLLTALCAVSLLGACGRQPIGLMGTGGSGDGGNIGEGGAGGGGYGGEGGIALVNPDCGYTTCSKSEFCEFNYPGCGPLLLSTSAPNGQAPPNASCTRLSNACDDYYDPVCGCDYKTYSNDCERRGAGVSLAHSGSCLVATGQRCRGELGEQCQPGDWCQPLAGKCDQSNVISICVSVPAICPRLYQPVCGCDGQTYGNDCNRQQSGFAKAHDGECPPMEFPLSVGIWGGEHVELNASAPENGGTMRFDCGSATVDQALMVKASGEFDWKGTYTPGTGGGQSAGRPEAARFYGTANGDYMTMVVEVSNRIVTKLQLGFQQMPTLFLCL